jgi:hypothetical protein
MKKIFILLLISITLSFNFSGKCEKNNIPIPWSKSLSFDGGGYWTIRVPLAITNTSKNTLTGNQMRIILSDKNGTAALVGKSVSGLRVADKNSVEFLFELENSSHERKRSGNLTFGDIITIPVEAEVDSTVTVFLYAGNSLAWLPPDIRDFTDNPAYSERCVNEWLTTREDDQLSSNDILLKTGSAETRKLSFEKTDQLWIKGLNWGYRVPIHIRNFSTRNIPAGVITINMRQVNNRIGKLYGYDIIPKLCLIDPQNPDIPVEISGDIKEGIRAMIGIKPLTEKILWLYLSKDPDIEGQSPLVEIFNYTRDHPDIDCRLGNIESRKPQKWPVVSWAINPLTKVFQQDIQPNNPNKDIKVYASRNSWKSFQIAIRSLKNLDANISITPIRNIGGKELPEPKIYKNGYVPVDFPVRYYRTPKISMHTRFLPDQAGSDGWPDMWPDPLIPIENRSICKLTGGLTQPVWFDIHIPVESEPGLYRGHIIIESSAGKIYMPLEVKVWNLTLPDKRHIPAIYDLRQGPGKNLFGDDMLDEKGWSRFLAEYNISPGMLAQPEFSYNNGNVTMQTEEFDKMAHFIFDELNNTMMYTPGFFYSVGWYTGAKPIFDLQPYSPEYVKAWKDAYSIFVDHITEMGWRKNFVLYLSDEPRIPLAFNAIAHVADMAKEVAPDVPIYVSSWDYVEEIAGHISAWGIGAQGQFPVNLIEERKKAGDRFIYTTDGQQCLDTPFPATERLMPWFCFKYGIDAFEFWGSTWWTFNPWEYGWHAFVKEGGGEQVKNPVRYPNGDGYLVYPGDEIGIKGPVPSIRLIAVREGVDDYEIFNALNKFAEEGNQDAKEALDMVKSLVITPHTGGVLSTSFMPDPDAVFTTRIIAGEVLDVLIKK